jgi:flagellar biosynthesis protein
MPDSDFRNKKAAALMYEQNSLAPRLIAKGQGAVAQTILARAQEYEIPVSVEPELVELLVQLDLNQLIPPELYAAVAEVLAWAYQVEGRVAGDLKELRGRPF